MADTRPASGDSRRTAQRRLRVVIDRGSCQGHARCVATAPELFDLDDEGISVPLEPVVEGAHVDALLRAVAACPELAITYEEVRP